MDWGKAARDVVGTVAPMLATALGGPLAGVATRVIAGALLGDEDAGDEAVQQAVLNASPADLVKLRTADQQFQARMKELDVDLERIHQADRASAREREIRTGDVWTPRLLGLGVIIGFFVVLWMLATRDLPGTTEDAIMIMLGSLGTMSAGVIAYYFGSSVGSKEKTDAISRLGRGR